MARRRKSKKTYYNYECSITGRKYTTEREAPEPKDLLSVNAYYEMHPEMDDRPEAFKTTLEEEESLEEEGN